MASLSVLVPAYNEEAGLAATVDHLLQALTATVEDFEIIVVDDGSVDATPKIGDELARRHPRVRCLHNERNRGLGYCYLRGIREARKSHFVYIPGDNSWPEASVKDIVGHLGKADIVTSYATNPEVRRNWRRWVSSLYTVAVNLLFLRRMTYYNGLTIYPRAFLLANPPTTYGFGFQSETLLKALADRLTYVEVGVPIDEDASTTSKAITARNVLSVVKTVARTFFAIHFRRPRPSAPGVTEIS